MHQIDPGSDGSRVVPAVVRGVCAKKDTSLDVFAFAQLEP